MNEYDYLPTEALISPKNEKELAECMKSQLWRLNNIYTVVNEHGVKERFRMKKIQYKFYKLRSLLNIILKSRQHGITTFCCLLILDTCLFVGNTKAGIVAHKMTAAIEIFREKIKAPYDNLPPTIKRANPAIKDDARQLVLNNGSSIVVDTSLRSGTYQIVHITEYGKMCADSPSRAKETQTGTLETVHEGSRITIEGTAEGRVGDFYDKCVAAMKLRGKPLGNLDYKFSFFAWFEEHRNRTDPQFVTIPEDVKEYLAKLETGFDIELDDWQKAWYAVKSQSLGFDIYKEHPSTPDEAFKALVTGSYFGVEIAIAREQNRIQQLAYERSLPVYTFWDIGHKHTSIIFTQFVQTQQRIIDYYEDNDGLGMQAYADMLIAKKYRYGEHFAPWDVGKGKVNSRSMQTGKDLLDVAKECGINFRVTDCYDVQTQIKTAIDGFKSVHIDSVKCDRLITCLEMYRAEWDENIEDYSKKPLHDQYSHGASAFCYLMCNYKWDKVGGKYMGDMRTPDYDYKNENKTKVLTDYDLLG